MVSIPSDCPSALPFLGPGSLSAKYRVERLASIWEPAKGCLVLLLSGVSGSGTMNGSRMRVYFDYNATTPLSPDASDAVIRAMRDVFGNASTVHHFGQQ